jgi:hypothetical protein
MKRARRQRNKKKFDTMGLPEKPKNATVKVKPKEEEPCSTKNPKPRARRLARHKRRAHRTTKH